MVACVNIIPKVQSVYWWDGKVNVDEEQLLIFKTETSLSPTIISAVKEIHPYDVPEVIFTPIQDGNDKYLEWISESVKEN